VISTAQATQYLEQSLGITVPAFIVSAACERVEGAEAAMLDAGYDDAKQALLQSMAVAIICAAGSPRRLSNQGAPSGASRGFKYADGDLTALRRSLADLDTAGTVSTLVGSDPTAASLFMVV
jgi:ABC-type phosphate/phosphonate transport system substrate-binding protein